MVDFLQELEQVVKNLFVKHWQPVSDLYFVARQCLQVDVVELEGDYGVFELLEELLYQTCVKNVLAMMRGSFSS
jgi:hypothetical protein